MDADNVQRTSTKDSIYEEEFVYISDNHVHMCTNLPALLFTEINHIEIYFLTYLDTYSLQI